MAKKKTDDAGIRFDPDNYVKIEYDKTAPSVKATIIQNGEVVEPDDYVTQGELSIILGDYVDTNDLGAALDPYATKAEVAADLANYPTKTEVAADLANYPTKAEVAANYANKADIPVIDGENLKYAGAVASKTYKDINITFNKTFTANPIVLCSLASSSQSSGIGDLAVCPINITTTGFTARIFNNDTSQREPTFNWLAISL